MNHKLLKALNKLYKYPNYDYDREREVSVYLVDTLSSADRELLEQHHWQANDIEHITHDSVIQSLTSMQANANLSWKMIAAAFVTGVGGSFPRGISPMTSYHQMLHTRPHHYEEAERFRFCKVCGFSHNDEGWTNASYIRYAVHLGNVYGKSPIGAYVDITEYAQIIKNEPLIPSSEDIAVFNRLLRSLAEAPEDETPGKYEKRLTSMKLVKGTAGVRRGILQSLATVGILPNQVLELQADHWSNMEDIVNGELQLNNTRGRSDMEMPWAGWYGGLGVDWDKAKQLFGEWIQT
jgi:hypothetical protein